MKKISVLLLFIAFSVCVNAQPCTPGNYTTPWLHPDTITNLPLAYALYPYSTFMTLVVPVDTTINGYTVPFDSVGITNITGLPTGFTYTPNSVSGFWHRGNSGCFLISGTPTLNQVGVHPIVVDLLWYLGGMNVPEQKKGYIIEVIQGIATIPTIITTTISNITSTTALSGGNITSEGGAAVTARGVCWSTNANPTINNSLTTDGSGAGAFTSNISGLTANTTYYVRSYATNSAGTAYGQQEVLTTLLSPSLISINPSSANAGATLNVTITGANTHFMQATWTTVDFGFNPGSGVVNTYNVIDDYTIDANITIPSATATGYYDVSVDNAFDGNLSINNGFHVFVNTCPAPSPVTAGATRCGTGSVMLSASGGSNYLWYNTQFGGSIINTGNFFNTPSLNTTKTYYVSNFDTCESSRVPVTATIINLNINAGNDQSVNCGSSVLLNTATTYNGTHTLVYAWSPTTGLSSASIAQPFASPVQTTTYTLMVSDGICSSFDNVAVNVNPTVTGVDFSVNQQLISAPPFAVQFNNLTPSLGNYNFTWHFGDGVTLQSNNAVELHQFAQNGLYDITLVATNTATGCAETMFKNDWISCAGGNNCTHTANITPTGTISGCVGTPVIFTCNIVPNATYQWNYNGAAVSGYNANSYTANASGNYSVTIIVNNCPVTSNLVTVTLNNPPAVPTITSTGSLTYCIGGSVILSATAGASSYLWSNGATIQNPTVTVSGNYTVDVSDVNGCITQSLPYLVGASPLSNPDICLVSVDNTGHNLIIWNEPVTTAIDYYNIYGEGTQANVFNLLGSVNYDSLSFFVDTTANPLQQTYRYKISAVDTCGAETAQSSCHQTIHLTINQGIGNTYNLIWSYYEGFTFSSYNIYRGASPSNMTLLTTITNTLNSYTDLTPPAGNVYYQIEALNPNSCSPSKAAYNYSKSNIVTNVPGIINGIDMANVDYNFEIYPNPANETITIDFNAFQNDNSFIEIYSIDGKLLKSVLIKQKKTEVNISSLSSGIYFVKVYSNTSIGIKKLIVE